MSVKTITANMMIRLYRLFSGTQRNTVTFMSFGGQSYADNPRAVSEALHRISPDVKIQWLMKGEKAMKDLPDYVHPVNRNRNTAFLKALATTGALVDNSRLPYIPKGKKQFFVQVWHGDKAFKKILYDSTFSEHKIVTPEAIDGYCDLAVAGSDYGEMQFRSAFRYKGRILMEGTPRNDRLLHPDAGRIARIKEKIGIPRDTKMLLYAPTLRREFMKNGQKQTVQEIDFKATLSKLEEVTGAKWACAVRAHPAMKGLTGFDPDSGILDLSDYGDMADLLEAADMLITDYSSCAGDFALTGRWLMLYQPDIEAYLEKDRTFYFDMASSPYLIAQTQQEVEDIISGLTDEKARENDRAILKFYGDHETGHAADLVAQEILKAIKA